MFCSNCGKEVADNAKFCYGCGAQLTPQATEETPVLTQEELLEKTRLLEEQAKAQKQAEEKQAKLKEAAEFVRKTNKKFTNLNNLKLIFLMPAYIIIILLAFHKFDVLNAPIFQTALPIFKVMVIGLFLCSYAINFAFGLVMENKLKNYFKTEQIDVSEFIKHFDNKERKSAYVLNAVRVKLSLEDKGMKKVCIVALIKDSIAGWLAPFIFWPMVVDWFSIGWVSTHAFIIAIIAIYLIASIIFGLTTNKARKLIKEIDEQEKAINNMQK